MLHSNGETEKLFAKPIPITIKDGYTNQCRLGNLFLTIEWQESSVALRDRELLITLTDSNDPFFLYNLHLSEDDFQVLKNSQGLLVDFSSFPRKFIELIELCIAETNKAQPKFLLVLNVGERIGSVASTSHLDVVETNPFKHLTHLSLKFLVATESSVKQYLAVCYRKLKEEKQDLQNRLGFLERDFKDKLTTCQDTLEKKSQELEIVRKELSVELSMKESRHARELLEERDKFLTKQREEECRLEKERQEKETTFKKQIQQFEARVSCLDSLNREIQEKNHKQEEKIRDLRSRVLSVEEELNRTKASLRSYKDQSEKLQGENRDVKLQVCHQKDSIEKLEQELYHEKQKARKMQEQLDVYPEELKKLEEKFRDSKDLLRREERAYLQLQEDVAKGNNVIEKLQREIQSGHEKLKSCHRLISKNEHDLQDKEKVIQMLKKDLTDAKIECKKALCEIKTLSDTAMSFKEKIGNLEKELKTKENVIRYFSRQLTDHCIIPQYVPPSNLPSVEGLKLNAAGDQERPNINNPLTAANGTRSKSFPSRVSFHTTENGTASTKKLHASSSAADSAYATSPSNNTKSTNIITGNVNAQQTNLEIDSQALSAAFGSDKILKHSTAKKQTYLKSVHNTKTKKS